MDAKQRLEAFQLLAYVAAIAAGILVGLNAPAVSARLEALLWPALAALLYATFCQAPLNALPRVLRQRRFFSALLLLNFVLLPLLAWGLSTSLLTNPVLILGALLVLLVPCTDWFVSFTGLGKGDVPLAVAATPLLLLVQLVTLPLYLMLILGTGFIARLDPTALLTAFALLIASPLALASLTQYRARSNDGAKRLIEFTSWLPVPLLALVLFLVAGAHAALLLPLPADFLRVVALFVVYLLTAGLLAGWLGRAFSLHAGAHRTLVFSAGTRNSFVVLPLALALPEAWQAAVAVIVLQSLVELLGIVVYVYAVPRLIRGR